MKIAMYGGSFDPPHLGHLNVVLHALNNYDDVDEIHVIPCFKQTGKNLTRFGDRMNMCNSMFGDLPRVRINAIEYKLGGESITARTITNLKLMYSTAWHEELDIALIVGSDTAAAIPNWEGGEELMQLIKGDLRIAPRTNISSTEIRKLAKNKCSLNQTTRAVEIYINDNDLYV